MSVAESDYFVIHLKNLSSKAEDWLSTRAFEFGALGMSEALPFEQPPGEEDVLTRIPSKRAVDVYFAKAPAAEFLHEIRSHAAGVEIQVKGEANRDWLAEWKKSFMPFP